MDRPSGERPTGSTRSRARREAGANSVVRSTTDWAAQIEAAAAQLPVIRNAETFTIADIWSDTFHQTPTHELVHVQQGRAEIQFKTRSFPVGPEDTFIIPKGVIHRDRRSDRVPCRFSYVFFEWPSGEALLQAIPPTVFTAMPAGNKAHLHFLIGELERGYLGDDALDADPVRVLLLEILLAILRQARPATAAAAGGNAARQRAESRRRLVAEQVRALLREQYREPLSLEALAEKFDVSPFHVSRIFSREFGMGISDMLTLIRMEHAQQLLNTGAQSVKEIAAAVGYGDSNYFSKVFRRVVGCSPSEYQLRAKRG